MAFKIVVDHSCRPAGPYMISYYRSVVIIAVIDSVFAARYYTSEAYGIKRCLCVRQTVMSVDSVATNKHILKILFTVG